MKQDLMELISAMPTIETHFRKFEPVEGLCVPSGEFIYDDSEFIEWQEAVKFELQEIYDRTNDTYIWNIINANGVIHKFNGKNYNERESFNKLKGSLSVIQKKY